MSYSFAEEIQMRTGKGIFIDLKWLLMDFT